MQNIIFLLIILIVIYLIFTNVIPNSILFIIGIFVLLWYLLNSKQKKEPFNTFIELGKRRNNSNITNYMYDDTDKIYTSTNYYNCPSCTLEKRCDSCIIPPDTTNLFPNDLKNLAKSTSSEYECNQGLLNYPKCSNTELQCNKKTIENFSVLTPNIPEGTLMDGTQPICNASEFPNSPGLSSKPPKGCCPQGYSFDQKK